MNTPATAGGPTTFGINRVLVPAGSLPQAADRIDATSPIRATEALVRVEQLNLDSASFQQIRDAHDGDSAAMRKQILEIVDTRGKMQNPVTGSGGVLIGTIEQIGDDFAGTAVPGDRIVTLVSLTATPLHLSAIEESWPGDSPVIPVEGTAVLTDGAIFAVIPGDMPEATAMSVLDVCGAPALAARVLQRPAIDGKTPTSLLILGGGKSASLSAVAARQLGIDVTIVVPNERERERLLAHEITDRVVVSDATNPLTTHERVLAATGTGQLPDVTLVCVNVPGVEHTALVTTRPCGAVVYFSMATSFSAVALGAEALGLDLDLIIGSGYVPGHAETALQLLREHDGLRRFFDSL